MLILEFLAVIVIAVVLVTVANAIGRPVAELLAQRAIYKYKELDSESAVKLQARLAAVEAELVQVRKQLDEIKEAADFTTKLLENSGFSNSNKIELSSKQPADEFENKA